MNSLYRQTTESRTEKRSLHRVMIEVNSELANIHKKIANQISITKYERATSYIAQFISYTTIWNLKFTYNLESPEVALMQILHLDHIFEYEEEHDFLKEKARLLEMKQLFFTYSPYSESLIQLRTRRFLEHLNTTQ